MGETMREWDKNETGVRSRGGEEKVWAVTVQDEEQSQSRWRSWARRGSELGEPQGSLVGGFEMPG